MGDVASDQRGFVASGQPALTAEVVYAGCPHPVGAGRGRSPDFPVRPRARTGIPTAACVMHRIRRRCAE